MHPLPPYPMLLLLLLAALLAASSHALAQRPPVAACTPLERDALLAFKQGINISSDAAGLLASWREDNCCEWRGVRCGNRTGHVVALNLRGQELDGEISPSLLSLPHLEHLDLSYNSLVGPAGSIPGFLGSLGNLRYLNLSRVPFSGEVPPHLGNLSKLHYLDLSFDFHAHVYSTDLSWLTGLPFLRFLDLSMVNLSTVADFAHVVNALPLSSLDLFGCSLTSANLLLPHSNLTTTLEVLSLSAPADLKNLCNLRFLSLFTIGSSGFEAERLPQCSSNKLQELYLMGNQLTGSLANWMGRRSSLVILDLSWNNITGPIPEFIGRFTDLRVLRLFDNQLTGHVPSSFGMLKDLTELDLSQNHLIGQITEEHFHGLKSLENIKLSDNQLEIVLGSEWVPPFRLQEAYLSSCQMGPHFPAWLKWQVDLTYLVMENTGITDRFPDWFSSSFSKITYLDISNNQISGALPKNMGNMSLSALYCTSNNISGRIPQLPRNLETLDISRNSLSGPLPSDFGAPNLSIISLFSNYITGQLTVFVCGLNLYSLDLANNLLEGELPKCFRTESMSFLLLSNNRLSGNFPPFLENCTELSFLDLESNRFSGTLPTWIGNLGKLQFLRLSNNMFYGHIPDNITSLNKLYHLNLASNGISGSIPQHLSNLTAITTPYVVDPYNTVLGFRIMVGDMPIVIKRQKLKYQGMRVLEISSIDFSCNYLTGKIPEEVTFLGGLINLNLSWNQLNGGLPTKIGDMQALESLDFSNNNISGEIPTSLSELTYLSILDLSYNHLAGKIPSGGQLDTLYTENPSIYNGNIDLCGPILGKKCSVNNNATEPDHQQTSEKGLESILFLYFGLGSGFLAGLWVVFCAMLFKKRWRIAYFRFFDTVHDKAYVFVVVSWGRLARNI